MGDSFTSALLNQWRTLFETPRLSPFGQSLMTKQMVQMHRAMTSNALRMLHNPAIELVYVHFAIPHMPHIYDLRTHALTAHNSTYRGYIGNLALMDVVFGQVRRALEQTGDWDRSLVLLTSDHWCRYSTHIDGKRDHRIPFIVKMPGQTAGRTYDRPFNTVVMRGLLHAAMRQQIGSASELAQWLDTNGRLLLPVERAGTD